MDKGRRTSSSKNWFGSCSSRVDANVVTYVADVDPIYIEEGDHLNNSDDAIIKLDDDADASINSIASDSSTDNDTTLADKQKEEKTRSAVCTRRTEQNNVSSAEEFRLAPEVVVCVRQDPIAYAGTDRHGTLTRMEKQLSFY